MSQYASSFGKLAAPIAILCVCALAVGGIAYAWNATSNTQEADVPVNYEYVVLSMEVEGSDAVKIPLSTVYTAATEGTEESTAYALSENIDAKVATLTITITDMNELCAEDITSVALNVTTNNNFFSYKYKIGEAEVDFTSDFTIAVNGQSGIIFDDSNALTVEIYAVATSGTEVTSVVDGSVTVTAFAKAGTF